MAQVYSHVHTLAFTVVNADPEGGATDGELLAALLARISDVVEAGEMQEACGMGEDVVADDVCPECLRSYGPHYRGPCNH